MTAAINLGLALGLPGRAGSGYGAITGQGNGQGGREHGQKADQLPGYRSITDPAARAHVADVWDMDPDDLPGPGLPAVQLLDCLGQAGGPRVLMVHGSNLSVSSPNAGKVIERLRSLDLLVVSDFVLSETAALADVVLPVTQWAEEGGTMTSLEGRVLRRRPALAPPPGVRSELDVFADLAERLGSPVRMAVDPPGVFDELARASRGGIADYGGLSHEPRHRRAVLLARCRGFGRHSPPFRRRLPHARRTSPDAAGRPHRSGRRSAAGCPAVPHHREGAAALSVGGTDASRRGAGPGSA